MCGSHSYVSEFEEGSNLNFEVSELAGHTHRAAAGRYYF